MEAGHLQFRGRSRRRVAGGSDGSRSHRLRTGAPTLFPVAGNDQGEAYCAFLITHHDPICLVCYTGLGSF